MAYHRIRYRLWDRGGVPRAYTVYRMDDLTWPRVLPEFESGLTDGDQFVRHSCARALARRGRVDGLRTLSRYGHWVKFDGEADLRALVPGLPPLDPAADVGVWFDTEVAPHLHWSLDTGWALRPPEVQVLAR